MVKSFPWHRHSERVGLLVILAVLSGCTADKKGPIQQTFGALDSQRRPAVEDTPPLPASDSETLISDLALGRKMEQAGELNQASEVYRKILSARPDHSLALRRLAVVTDRQGKFAYSARYFEQAIRMSPRDADTLCDFGYSLYRQQRWAEAEDRFRQALEVDPRHRRTHNNYGLLLARTDRHAEALLAFHEAGCSDTESHMNLALGLELAGRPAEAQRQLDQVADAGQLSVDARNRLNHLQQLIRVALADSAQSSPSPCENRTVAHWE